jgi:hypothetical protein
MLHASPLPAQQPAQVVSPAPQSPSSGGQQSGAGAQLQTGTSSGLSTDARLLNLLADHQYRSVEAQLGQLPPDQAQFYSGILANRSNHLEQSISLLEPLVARVSESGDTGVPTDGSSSAGWSTAHEKLLRKTLAEDYLRLGEWAKAADAYQALDARFKDKLTSDEQDEIELPVKLLPLIRSNPPTTIEPCDPFKLPVSGDPLGLVDLPVFVDARSRNWMLDPTLPFNLIAHSTARDAGLKISTAGATISSLTGRTMQVHATVVPRFTIGGRLTLRDMTAFVYEDKDYFFPQASYQVEGVLGYPALAAMGSLTVNSDNTVFIRPARQISPPEKDDLLTTGARFYLDGDQVVVALGRAGNAGGDAPSQPGSAMPGKVADHAAGPPDAADGERMYAVDAGGQQTYLTSRYFDEHAAEFNQQKMEMFSLLGAQSPPQPAYTAENVPLQVGDSTVTLHFIHVLSQPLGTAALDDVYGVLGSDALGQLKSYTFDYRSMMFTAAAE